MRCKSFQMLNMAGLYRAECRTFEGIQVFPVAREQLWEWSSWNGRTPDPCVRGLFPVIADTMRKGAYVVVENSARFGHMQLVPEVIGSSTSLRGAVGIVRDAQHDTSPWWYSDMFGRLCFEWEIWHVIADDVLLAWDDFAGMNGGEGARPGASRASASAAWPRPVADVYDEDIPF